MVAARDDVRRLLGEGKKQAEIARELGISAGRVSQLVKELGINKKAKPGKTSPAPAVSPKGTEKPKTDTGKPRPKPPPGPNGGGFKPGNPGGPGGPPGNDKATKTGLHRNPMLHSVSALRAALVHVDDATQPAEILRHNIAVYQLSVMDMTQEIEAIQGSRSRMWVLGTTYTRQEGDGELMGTGRISQRKRVPRAEALRMMIEARSKVQGKLDQALRFLHEMTKSETPQGNNTQQFQDALNATAEDVWGEEDGTGNEEA